MFEIKDKERRWGAVVRWASTIMLGVGAWLFWAFGYPHAMAYQEQFQLFLFDGGYFTDRLAVPGGVAAYVAEFLTQFYNHYLIGAFIIAALLVCLQMLTWRLAVKRLAGAGKRALAFILSFLPPLLLWYFMGDENVMLSFTVSLELTLLSMLLMPMGHKSMTVYGLVMIPLMYWVTGPLVLLLALYIGAEAMVLYSSRLKALGYALLAMLYALVVVLVSGQMVPYPLFRLFLGIYYYRLPVMVPVILLWVVIVCFVPMLARWLPSKGKWAMAAGLVAVVFMALLVPRGYDERKYSMIEYDYLVRRQLWHKIIDKAEREHPDLPMSVCAQNLALGMTNQLGDRLFDFYQHGTEGLFPAMEQNYSTSLFLSNLYFHLGLVNTAQRYAFEAMEAIPNYNKSGRAVKRLAETNLINGQYQVARKYLNMLSKTVFYRKWAQTRLELLDHPKLIDSHPLYGAMRKLRLQEDFLFSDTEMDKICGKLVAHNPGNKMAMQYLLMYPILNGDLETFMRYYAYVQTLTPYRPKVAEMAARKCSSIRN